MAGVKTGEDNRPKILPPAGSWSLSCPESAENWHGRDAPHFSREWQLAAVSGQLVFASEDGQFSIRRNEVERSENGRAHG